MLTPEQLKNLPLICDISNEAYHSSLGVSNSGISLLLDCPLKYWDRYLNPNKPADNETPSMRFGSLVHCFLLEPAEFYKRYMKITKMNKNTKVYKEFAAANQGKEFITEEEMNTLLDIKKAVESHKIAKYLFEGGKAEQSIFWKDKETGVLCKSRPDYMTDSFIADIKTTRCASPDEFKRSIAKFGYHRQAAIATDGVGEISGFYDTPFVNVCIEIERPYLVSVFTLSDAAIEQGRREYKKGLTVYQECMAKHEWPGYVNEVVDIDLPHWALDETARGDIYVS